MSAADPNRPIDVSFLHALKADPVPTLLSDAEYPAWVFDEALYNPPSLAELRVKKDQGEEMSDEDVKRLHKLERRRKIKSYNEDHKRN